ncbi:MAG: hypothetical protein H9535_01045 [Ignavibacteria bacterium]|nr:hypothetical protein [Ignavibacteria bacterium]
MNYSELLHDWIDGTLASQHEEAVFIALAHDPELRTELQDLIRIRAAVQNDTAAFTPSPADTSAIFGRLGFSVPADIPSLASAGIASANLASAVVGTAVGASASASAGAAKVLSGLAVMGSAAKVALAGAWRSYGAVLASACVASLATVLLMNWRTGGTSNSNIANNGAAQSANASSANHSPALENSFGAPNNPNNPNNPSNLLHPTNPSLGGMYADTVRERVIVREIVKETVRYVHEPSIAKNEMENENGNNAASRNESAHVQTVNVPKESAAEMVARHAVEQASKRSSAPSIAQNAFTPALTNTPDREETFTDVLHRFRLGVRGFTTLSLPAPSMEPSATPFFNNAALSLHYALSPNHLVGVEVGQEAFFQRYQSTENQDTYTVTQYPTQWWAGLTYRYNFTPEDLCSPYASATLGVAGYGFLGRTQVGCTYSPDGVTQFLLGVEASALLYGHQGVNYWSPKVGVTYGVSLRL